MARRPVTTPPANRTSPSTDQLLDEEYEPDAEVIFDRAREIDEADDGSVSAAAEPTDVPNAPDDPQVRPSANLANAVQRHRNRVRSAEQLEMEALGKKLFPEHPTRSTAMATVFTRMKTYFPEAMRGNPITQPLRQRVLAELVEDHRKTLEGERTVGDRIPWLTRPTTRSGQASGRKSSSKTLPKVPPESWSSRDLNKRENPVQFLKRVYKPWLDENFEMRFLRPIDPDLYRACSVWMHRHPEDRIQEAQSLRDRMAEIIEELSSQLSDEELRRLGYAIDARLRKK